MIAKRAETYKVPFRLFIIKMWAFRRSFSPCLGKHEDSSLNIGVGMGTSLITI